MKLPPNTVSPSGVRRHRTDRWHAFHPRVGLLVLGVGFCLGWSSLTAAVPAREPGSTWPQSYTVLRDESVDRLILSNRYYVVQQDLRRGGVICGIRLIHGRASNLLVQPIETRVRDRAGAVYTDTHESTPRISQERRGMAEIVTVECALKDAAGRACGIQAKTVYEYRWGYVRIHKELRVADGPVQVREVTPLATVLSPSLTDYGYREGMTEAEGAPAFSFGSNKWGKLRGDNDAPLRTAFIPRSMLFADPGVEGLEWFVGSDLSQWDLQLTGRRGQGECVLERSVIPRGLRLAVSPLLTTNGAVPMPEVTRFDFSIGVPILEGRATQPWLHASFNRNRGEWVSADQVKEWAASGIQTVHCHNDGDYYDDGLFWRDGSYPPYPDMDRFDQVIRQSHEAGIRVATYFSNKELHPSTKEFQQRGSEWGRKDLKGNLQHNFYRGTNEFGVQMCLRSGWLDFLKFSIDRVLKNHPLDGVYYDWNVALWCANGSHEGKDAGATPAGHWDMDELLDLMEWTRMRVGPSGLVIVHNTTTPMFTLENFADHVVANEWGYGKWTGEGPALAELPLEWSLVGARSRGVISYGQIEGQAPRRLHRVFALEALVSGVSPWPASPEAIEFARLLRPLGDVRTTRFADWRNDAVRLQGKRCASAIYGRLDESFLLLANLDKAADQVGCVVDPRRLPFPLPGSLSAVLMNPRVEGGDRPGAGTRKVLDGEQLVEQGIRIEIPADSLAILHLRRAP